MTTNAELQKLRETAIPRGVSNLLPVFTAKASNAELWDVEGKRYIDFAGGIAVLNTGHLHPKVQAAVNDLTAIAGQKAVVTLSKKAIANFKIRKNDPVGVKVTLRKDKMYEFLDRLITMALPRVRDFRGVSGRSFDGRGNYAMGLKEHIVFLEIDYDKTESVWGMDIVIQTTAKTDAEAKALLAGFQLPFVN